MLRNEDLTETVRAFLDDEIDDLVERYLSAEQPDDWGMEGLVGRARGDGPRRARARPRTSSGRSAAATRSSQHLRERWSTQELDAREAARRRRPTGRLVERFVLLRTIDSLWVEHLTELDDMRRGIGLRGYAQQDPLNEFRKEAFRLYEELRGLIRHQVATTIFRVSVTRQAPTGPQPLDRLGLAVAAGARRSGPGRGAGRAPRRRRRPAARDARPR